jgi:hypothetical protein
MGFSPDRNVLRRSMEAAGRLHKSESCIKQIGICVLTEYVISMKLWYLMQTSECCPHRVVSRQIIKSCSDLVAVEYCELNQSGDLTQNDPWDYVLADGSDWFCPSFGGFLRRSEKCRIGCDANLGWTRPNFRSFLDEARVWSVCRWWWHHFAILSFASSCRCETNAESISHQYYEI